jgi:hypothetical protein
MFRFCFWPETYNHVVSVQDGHALLNEARCEGFESMFFCSMTDKCLHTLCLRLMHSSPAP